MAPSPTTLELWTTGRRRWAAWALVLVVAAVARVAAAAWWESRIPAGERFVFGDSHSYWALAGRIARGESFDYGADAKIFRTPGYPATLALLFRLAGGEPSVFAARCWGAAWGVGAVAATMALARLTAGERSAPEATLLAGLIAAVQPEAIASSVFVLSEATFALPMLLQLVAWGAAWRAAGVGGEERRTADDAAPLARASESPRAARRPLTLALLAGVAAGLATLMRPGWLLFTPWSLVVLAIARRPRPRSWRRDLALGAALCLGLALTMSPWWWRNYRIAGRFVATTMQVGASLYDGLNPEATGASDMRFVPAFHAAQRAEDAARETPPVGTFEERVDARMRDASLDWARAQGGAALRLAATKTRRLWNVWPNAGELGGTAARLAIAAAYLPLVVLAAIGAWTARGRRPLALLCLLPIGYLTSLHVVFVSSIRYRQPAIFTLSALAALPLADWLSRRRT